MNDGQEWKTSTSEVRFEEGSGWQRVGVDLGSGASCDGSVDALTIAHIRCLQGRPKCIYRFWKL
jgi:hypothetical protein